MSRDRFPSKKDLAYWVLALILLCIFIFVVFQINPDAVNSKLSLTATLSSIALAIIAIIFSFVQSGQSSEQLAKISYDLNEVTRSIVNLNVIKDEYVKGNAALLKQGKEITEGLKTLKDQNPENSDLIKAADRGIRIWEQTEEKVEDLRGSFVVIRNENK